MSKGNDTRKMILARAAPIFNQQGFVGSSLADLMRATGLEKGGIYNHFTNKEQLALETFDYTLALIQERWRQTFKEKRHAIDRLLAMLDYFQGIIDDPPVPGGCPILNLSVEADDTNPALRTRAQEAMNELQDTLRRILVRGIEREEIRSDVDIENWVILLLSTMEGAIMLSQLYQESRYVHSTADSLRKLILSSLPLTTP
ncbi:TetR/AcrR family transcriptional regulator [Ktedonospora formicarum]|uniref:TetR family transcriptional regulator n=1 Tax=Ktedonospora formicarum TaxID=2778364 RepID=A0A8J3MSK7_9CHLR|nr:TetR/AcrR family transcriptional regulator [Ktedonospora formicarum]GHO46225.1 TetR family transcriptional regulator [Ktedonospora formicarum]